MNYLAHSYLSFNHHDLMIGNFIADSIQGNKFEGLTENIIKGITLHRKIDVFTDQHLVYLKSKHRFSNDYDKYSGVLMDIFYDHFLAKNFEKYSSLSLENYSQDAYKILGDNTIYFPEHAKRFYQYVTERNIFYHYSTIEGIETVLTHLSHRIKHRYHLNLSIPLLKDNYIELENEFFLFFDELISFCKNQSEVITLT
jgi:acyl carrier protein phosphodiesterase